MLSAAQNVANPVFGPAAIISYVSPADGMFGPARTRAPLLALDGSRNFGNLFREVRRAGFLGEFELRTLVQTDATFDIESRALVTPCFPVTSEPGLTVEMILLMQNAVGQVREKWLARDQFFTAGLDFVDDFLVELPLSRFNTETGRYDESSETVVEMRASACDQFSYVRVGRGAFASRKVTALTTLLRHHSLRKRV